MDHMRPDLQRDLHVRRTGPRSDLDRVIEQCFGTPHLDEQRRKPLEIGMEWGSERRPWSSLAKIPTGQFQDVLLADHRVDWLLWWLQDDATNAGGLPGFTHELGQ